MAEPGEAAPLLRPADARFDQLYREHWHEIYRFVRSRFGAGPPEPEEVTQAAFAKLAAVAEPASIHNLGAYLRRTAVNIVLEAHRRRSSSDKAMRNVAIFEEQACDFSPEDIVSSKEDLARLNHAIAQLKPKQRVALLLHRIDGLSFVEIAREMNISQSGARLLVDTALRHCAAAMQKKEG